MVRVLNRADFYIAVFGKDGRKKAIVGSQEKILSALRDEGTPRAADARINNRHMHRPLRIISIAGLEEMGGFFNRMRRDMIRDINEGCLWVDGENHSLHARHERITIAEIGQ